jgi:hypothetical protein
MLHFARGFALSAEGKLTDAQAELKQLQSAAAAPWLKEQKIFDLNSLAQLAAISSAMLQGEIAAGEVSTRRQLLLFTKPSTLKMHCCTASLPTGLSRHASILRLSI